MTLDELMESNSGEWIVDHAVVKQGPYFVQVATRSEGVITLTPTATNYFPGLELDNTAQAKKLTKKAGLV